MSKARGLPDELQNLDMGIQSRIDEVSTLEAGLPSSPRRSVGKAEGGRPRRVDDVCARPIILKGSIEYDTNEIISCKLKLSRLINKVSDPKEYAILRTTYISK